MKNFLPGLFIEKKKEKDRILAWQTKKRSFLNFELWLVMKNWLYMTIRNAKKLGESQIKVVKQWQSLDCI